ncbi:MAG: aldehyde dehydrogenase family protein [Pseudomonadota bacterium]
MRGGKVSLLDIHSFAGGAWVAPGASAQVLADAATGRDFARIGDASVDMGAMRMYAIDHGAAGLARLGLHDRARILGGLARALAERRLDLAELSFAAGSTLADQRLDIDRGIAFLKGFAETALRDLPDGFWQKGPARGDLRSDRVYRAKDGVAVQVNAFGFPIYDMLSKLAPALLAGMPVIVKPATQGAFVTEQAVRVMLEAQILPPGALQLLTLPVTPLIDLLTAQDVVVFSGSPDTEQALRDRVAGRNDAPSLIAKAQSATTMVLGPDFARDSETYRYFLSVAIRDITSKAGQTLPGSRRVLVPEDALDEIGGDLAGRLRKIVIGNPRDAHVEMGPVISADHRYDVMDRIELLMRDANRLCGTPQDIALAGIDWARGAYIPPTLLRCDSADASSSVHEIETYGPVATLIGYRDTNQAIDLASRGAKGPVRVEFVTADTEAAQDAVQATLACSGLLRLNDGRATSCADHADEPTAEDSPTDISNDRFEPFQIWQDRRIAQHMAPYQDTARVVAPISMLSRLHP